MKTSRLQKKEDTSIDDLKKTRAETLAYIDTHKDNSNTGDNHREYREGKW